MRKRCVTCGFECSLLDAPMHFYRRRTWRGDGFQARCKACERARSKAYSAANMDRRREWARETRERIKADPERAAAKRAYNRDYMRRKRGTPPERFQVGQPEPRGLVAAAPVQEAIRNSGLSLTEISARAGYAHEGAARHALERELLYASTAVRLLAAVDVLPAEVGL